MNKVIAFVPKWKVLLYFILSAIFTNLVFIVSATIISALKSQSSRLADLVELVGSFGIAALTIFVVIIFGGFLYLFYCYERERYGKNSRKDMLEEIKHISKGHFGERIANVDDPQLSEWASTINTIIAQAEKAINDQQESAKLKNDLITNVAHDLRSPLTSIVGYLDLVNGDRYKDEVELRHYVQIVHNKAEGLHQMINDLFEYTLVQNKESLSNRVPLNPVEMLNQMAMQHQQQVQEAGMEIRIFVPTAADPYVLGDGNKLARVFENLIQNAIRYGKDGKYIDISVMDSDRLITIEVSNYGPKIPAAELPHLFDRFYRIEKSRSKESGGSGLGLAIVKSIIELHGGQVQAVSTHEKTTFVVRFPTYNSNVNEIL